MHPTSSGGSASEMLTRCRIDGQSQVGPPARPRFLSATLTVTGIEGQELRQESGVSVGLVRVEVDSDLVAPAAGNKLWPLSAVPGGGGQLSRGRRLSWGCSLATDSGAHRLRSCGTRALVLHGVWNLPGPGIIVYVLKENIKVGNF